VSGSERLGSRQRSESFFLAKLRTALNFCFFFFKKKEEERSGGRVNVPSFYGRPILKRLPPFSKINGMYPICTW
jgi:hypothetical protein